MKLIESKYFQGFVTSCFDCSEVLSVFRSQNPVKNQNLFKIYLMKLNVQKLIFCLSLQFFKVGLELKNGW